jgi:FAD/FMN-containing dehydrogenase
VKSKNKRGYITSAGLTLHRAGYITSAGLTLHRLDAKHNTQLLGYRSFKQAGNRVKNVVNQNVPAELHGMEWNRIPSPVKLVLLRQAMASHGGSGANDVSADARSSPACPERGVLIIAQRPARWAPG